MAEYVERREQGLYVTGSCVSVDSLVYAFREGASPESMQQDFPTLTLEQIYGAIAFYGPSDYLVGEGARSRPPQWK